MFIPPAVHTNLIVNMMGVISNIQSILVYVSDYVEKSTTSELKNSKLSLFQHFKTLYETWIRPGVMQNTWNGIT